MKLTAPDELVEDMKKLVAECPKAASDALFEVAESFSEDVNAKMPGSYSDKIKKWKIQGAKEGTSSFVTSTNRAPGIFISLKMDMRNTTFMDILREDLFRVNITRSRPGRNTRRNIQR